MSSVQLPPPRLPNAPEEYEQSFMADLIRSLELFISQETNPGEMRGTKLTLTDLPSSDSGLEAGSLYRIGNNVKISLLDVAVPDSLSATLSVGSVTVTVT